MKKPELVLPAGDLEKLRTACDFGADAVYVGGKAFSLRSFAGNFDSNDMKQGLQYAHARDKKVYAAVNVFAHNRDINNLPNYLEELGAMEVDGFIISDPGVFQLAKKYAPQIPVTISTQANVSNYETVAFYEALNARRVVLARELSLDEMIEIKQQTNTNLEVFVHGAMCVSYSGRCLLSHFMTGRSANQGACAHPCRYRYQLSEEKRPGEYFPIEEDDRGSYILNSRDLCLLEYLPDLIEAGVDAFKVEGRMKSPLYVATVARVYRQAIDVYMENRASYSELQISNWMNELSGIATRPFTNGFVEGESDLIQDINKEELPGNVDFCGVVKGYDADRQLAEVEQRANFGPGEKLEILQAGGAPISLDVKLIMDHEGNSMDRARHPKQRVFLQVPSMVEEGALLRRMGK
ncbi:MAG: U32 family peptidase [Bacillota bacterium]|nr:U32 family peptidase [Bacillota bacterium]